MLKRGWVGGKSNPGDAMPNCYRPATRNFRLSPRLFALAVWLLGATALLLSPGGARADGKSSDVLYLEPAERPRDLTVGITYSTLLREIVRQEFLVVAREEMGLRTRDGSLREPKPDKLPDANAFQITVVMRLPEKMTVTVRRGAADKREILLEKEYTPVKEKAEETACLVTCAEETLRKDFAAVLAKAGFPARPARAPADEAVPEETERLLGQVNETSQYAALVRLHAAARAKGETPRRLAALARAYAQLGVLTEFHWAADYRVFKARALLYVRRLVDREANSPDALRERAYVLALVGLHRVSMDDNAAAFRLHKAATPASGRAALADAVCHYDAATLLKLADKDKKNAEWARLLAFLAVEDFSAVHRTLAAGRKLLETSPECYRVHDALGALGGVSVQHGTSLAGFETFTEAMPKRLATLPGLPAAVSAALERQAPEPDVLEALVESSRTPADPAEPSRAVLARVLQETRFALAWRRIDFLDHRLAVSAADFVEKALPLVAGHPYAPVLEAFKLPRPRHVGEHLKLLSQVPLVDLDLNRVGLIGSFGEVSPDRNVQVTNLMLRFGDNTCRTLTQLARYLTAGPTRLRWPRLLLEVCPYSPTGRAALINADGDGGEKWVAQWPGLPNPTVLRALGRHHAKLKKWPEAEKCFKESIELSPDSAAFQELAGVYKSQDKLDAWKETLEASIKEEDTALNHAQVRVQIAREYFRRKDFKAALPYAEAAAGTGAGWALLAAGECQEGLGNWAEAESYVRGASERYTDGWFNWYVWCRRTGHGDVAAAEKFTQEWLAETGGRLSGNDLLTAAVVYLLGGKPDKAIEIAYRWEGRRASAGPFLLAAIQDTRGRAKERDQLLRYLPAPAGSPSKKVADLFLRCTDAGEKGRLDLEAVEAALKAMAEVDRTDFYYFVGHFLALRGDKKNAAAYLERCASAVDRKSDIFRALAAVELRENPAAGGKSP
jgi:tetratricopeptide (TPR) repeat protein